MFKNIYIYLSSRKIFNIFGFFLLCIQLFWIIIIFYLLNSTIIYFVITIISSNFLAYLFSFEFFTPNGLFTIFSYFIFSYIFFETKGEYLPPIVKVTYCKLKNYNPLGE